ncbi:SDR family oxidoreductase [Mesorhizobium atlanticum]|uniref:Short-chain dehydrogenase n=1 Tax=Mesorhizobium atlanticum TaxID=2233532 RepID=A0A330GGJ7_9HYPH|nr:SDR family oxidoreductase [Mesorhizobium atlanticum]RAZ71754.1 short-chain dehydrogenase [Mesorhizobium atlanticum]
MSQPGRIVIITGAVGGIGRALVEVLAMDGDTVVAVDLPGSGVVELARDLGHPHVGFECDVSHEEEVLRLYDRIEAQFAQISVLINNAAIGPTMAASVDTAVDAFRLALAVNVIGPFFMAREAARRMRPGGAIVNVASIAGILGNPKRNAYAASKAGLISLTKSLACEWAARGIRVTAVAPGYVRTPMVAELECAGKVDLQAVRRRVPLGRLARPDEIALTVRFLSSTQARYITGAVLAVDGGWTSFNQPGHAHPPVDGVPQAELCCPAERTKARVVLVTGAANGIGPAIVRRFAANGDTVVIADKDGAAAAELAARLRGNNPAKCVDVAVESEVVALLEELRARFGCIDVLVNGAGAAGTLALGTEQTPEHIQRVLDVNLTAAFTCAREAIKAMRPGGVILNVGSVSSFLPFAPAHAYGASQAGLDILTRCLAAELGPVDIRTATLAPGYICTADVAQSAEVGCIDMTTITQRIPMGGMGQPEDVADAAFYLASSAASYVSGSILYVDGGWTSFGDAGNAFDLDSVHFAEAAC